MSSILTRLLLASTLLGLGGCERRVAPAPASASAPASVPASPATVPASPATAVAAETAAPTAAVVPMPAGPAALALDPEGLRIIDTRNGASNLLPFGTRKAATVAALNSVLGAPPVEQGDVDDCNASYARWPSGLGAWFTVGNFSGWAVPAEASGLATAAGVGPGSTRAELDAAYDAIVFESSLGTEFTAGELAGVLSSDAPDGRITHLWSGNTCIAR
jgi:hypothetical protein